MRETVATWNTQGFNEAKWAKIEELANTCSVVFIQEAGALANERKRGNLFVYGWPGEATDGNKNNRVSLAIVSNQRAVHIGFLPAETRGLGFIVIGSVLYGTWHENRGRGWLGATLGSFKRTYPSLAPDITSYVIGGDFNDTEFAPVKVGSATRGGFTLNSSDYNLAYGLRTTHKKGLSGKGMAANLDRVFVSNNLTIVHHWAIEVPYSDHNPVCATVVGSASELTYWEAFKSHLSPGSRKLVFREQPPADD